MDSIEKYIEDLKSPNVNKRFDACYYLRLSKDIPELAALALQKATNDPDHLVAKEARKALQAHSILIEVHGNESKQNEENLISKNSASLNFLKVYGWIILIGLVLSLLIFGPGGFIFLLAFVGAPVLFLILVIGVIGYFVSSSRGNKTASSTTDTKETKADMESTDSSK